MERQKSALTPENYSKAIVSLSRRYSTASSLPGNNFTDLAEWMLQERNWLATAVPLNSADHTKPFSPSSAPTRQPPYDLVVVYNSGERSWSVQSYSQDQHDQFHSTDLAPNGGTGQIVFVRGSLSPRWVATLGSKYHMDPEFFRRHINYTSTSIGPNASGFFSIPSLPSSSDNIFCLCVSTILHRDGFGGQTMQSQRVKQKDDMVNYKKRHLNLANVACGDSIVREYSLLDPHFSVIEQWISFCLARTGKGWTVVVCMDNGRALEKSPVGPWVDHIRDNKATVIPVLQHHHKLAFRTTRSRLQPDDDLSTEAPQSTSVLPLQYDSVIALADLSRRSPYDPLSMCIPLFAHAAFSEVQFLNVVESRIQFQMDAITERPQPDAVHNFQYFSIILRRHVQQLKDGLQAIHRLSKQSSRQETHSRRDESPFSADRHLSPGRERSPISRSDHERRERHRGIGGGPRGSTNSDGAFTLDGLLRDYEGLLSRCGELSSMCSQGITLAMSTASIRESQKAIKQSERVKRLTILATLFIPLNLSSSLLGMNIDLLGMTSVRFWWFFVVSGPIIVGAYMLYLWDWDGLKRRWQAFREASRRQTCLDPNETEGGMKT